MELRGLLPRVTGLAVGAAALGGLLVGALISTDGQRGGATANARASGFRPPIPPFVVLAPTATPRPDHPSPDLGNLVRVKKRHGDTVLVFDRVTVRGTEKTGYTIDNRNPRTRNRTLASKVEVIGGEKLTRQPAPKQVPLAALLDYVRRAAADQPLLAWLSYDEHGDVVQIREQNLP